MNLNINALIRSIQESTKCSTNEAGKALKTMIQKSHSESKEKPKHICTNCKYRHMILGYDQQWGYYFVIENWCDKDKNLMYAFYQNGNKKHFTEKCDFFECGGGIVEYDTLSIKEQIKNGK